MQINSYNGMINKQHSMPSKVDNKSSSQIQQDKDKQDSKEQAKITEKQTLRAEKKEDMSYAPLKPNMMDKKSASENTVDLTR